MIEIQEHMTVIGKDGVHVSTVDRVEGDRIKLTKEGHPGEPTMTATRRSMTSKASQTGQ